MMYVVFGQAKFKELGHRKARQSGWQSRGEAALPNLNHTNQPTQFSDVLLGKQVVCVVFFLLGLICGMTLVLRQASVTSGECTLSIMGAKACMVTITSITCAQ